MKSQFLRKFRVILAMSVLALCSACAIIYEQDLQQGNVVTDEMLNNLEPGMSKTEVQYYIGTPLIEDPFHANRWDYFYAFQFGGDKQREQRVITLLFDELDQLADITGSAETMQAEAVDVTLPDEGELNTVVSDVDQKNESFWQGIKRRMIGQ